MKSFSQPHFVGEYAAESVFVQGDEPVQPLDLVLTQGSVLDIQRGFRDDGQMGLVVVNMFFIFQQFGVFFFFSFASPLFLLFVRLFKLDLRVDLLDEFLEFGIFGGVDINKVAKKVGKS